MQKKRIAALFAAGVLALSAAACGSKEETEDGAENKIDVNVSDEGVALEEESGQTGGTVQETDKVETVQVQAAADGTVQEITVETTLKPQEGETIRDASSLEDVKNTKGDEEFTQESDGTLVWENGGESISYEGTGTEEIPVTVTITYYLDGEETAPEEMAGKSGKVTMRFDYENHTLTDEEADGESDEESEEESAASCVPFAAVTMLTLSGDHFSNIETENCRLVSAEDEAIVVGTVFPGLQEALGLSEYEITEDVEIPDYMEITADATDFALDFTATVVSPGLLADADLDGLDEADEWQDALEELGDASLELVDGAESLADGAGEFGGYLDEYLAGVTSLQNGVTALTEGAKTLNDQQSGLLEGANSLKSSLEELENLVGQANLPSAEETSGEETSADAAAQAAAGLNEAANTQAEAALEAALAATDLTDEQKEQLRQNFGSVDLSAEAGELLAQSAAAAQSELTSLETMLTQLHDAVTALADGASRLASGLEAYLGGVTQVYTGLQSLESGVSQLAGAGTELSDGAQTLAEGAGTYLDGVKTFDEEGIQELEDKAGNDLGSLADRIRALQKADQSCTTYAGLTDGWTGSVRYIIETAEVE